MQMMNCCMEDEIGISNQGLKECGKGNQKAPLALETAPATPVSLPGKPHQKKCQSIYSEYQTVLVKFLEFA